MKFCPQCEKEYPAGDKCPNDGTLLIDQTPRADPLVGATIAGKWVIEEKIARGGMGTVFRAKSISGGEAVAVKVLHANLQEQPEAVKRFFREAKSLGALHHPNIVRFFDVGQMDNGQLYMAMEFLFGQTLDQLVRTQGPLPLDLITTLMPQICNAVSAAHRARVVHRDITPQNILLAKSPKGEIVKLVDFGIAKNEESHTQITQTGIVMGTPAYLAPEQITGESATDPRSDIYALGAVLYFMICGKRPYQGPNPQAILAKQLMHPPEAWSSEAFGLPDELRAVVMQAMSKRPDDRFQSADEMLSAFADAIGGKSRLTTDEQHIRETMSAYRKTHPGVSNFGAALATQNALKKAVRKRNLARAGVTLAVVGALVLAGIAVKTATQEKPPPVVDNSKKIELPAKNAAGELLRGITTQRVYVGLSADFSANTREAGRALFVGIKTAFRAVNDDEGGVYARQLQAVALDDAADPNRAAKNSDELIDTRGVFAMIGGLGTATSSAILAESISRDMVYFGPVTGAGLLRDRPIPKHLFHYRPSYAEEAKVLVRHVVLTAQKKAEAVAIFAEEGEGGHDCAQGVIDALRENGHPDATKALVAEYPRNTENVEAAVALLLKAKPEAVVLCSDSWPAARLVTAMRAKNQKPLFAGVSLIGSALLEDEFGKQAPQFLPGTVSTQVVPPYTSDQPFVVGFRNYLSKYYPESKHGFITFEGYILGRLFAMATKLAGNEPTTEKLIAAIERMHDVQFVTDSPIRFGATEHQGSHKVWLNTWNEQLEVVPIALPPE